MIKEKSFKKEHCWPPVFFFLGLAFIGATLSSCVTEDQFIFSFSNQTSEPVNIEIQREKIRRTIPPFSDQEVSFRANIASFALTIERRSLKQTYGFGDYDHWFGVRHSFSILIDESEMKVEGENREMLRALQE